MSPESLSREGSLATSKVIPKRKILSTRCVDEEMRKQRNGDDVDWIVVEAWRRERGWMEGKVGPNCAHVIGTSIS